MVSFKKKVLAPDYLENQFDTLWIPLILSRDSLIVSLNLPIHYKDKDTILNIVIHYPRPVKHQGGKFKFHLIECIRAQSEKKRAEKSETAEKEWEGAEKRKFWRVQRTRCQR